MYRINKNFRYYWGGVTLGVERMYDLGESLFRAAVGRKAGRRHLGKSALVVRVSDIQARPDSAYRMNWGASPVAEYPIIQGQVTYPPSPLELAIRQNQQAGVNMVSVA